jgi:exodeoxyribonuclease VII large subunit
MKVKTLQNSIQSKLKAERTKFIKEAARLDTLSPLKTLTRGYSIVSSENEEIIKSVNDLKCGDNVNIRLKDGTKKAKVL